MNNIQPIIESDDLSGPEVQAFLLAHVQEMRRTSPPGSSHALDLEGLKDPMVSFWSVWLDQKIAGCGALSRLDDQHVEIKSMRTCESVRGRGLGKLMLEHLLSEARKGNFRRVSLETGSIEFFEPARRLYSRYGFSECPPFANYKPDPHSVFMTLELA